MKIIFYVMAETSNVRWFNIVGVWKMYLKVIEKSLSFIPKTVTMLHVFDFMLVGC